MKRCTKCGTAYTDETLRYCLADGAELLAEEEFPTVPATRPQGVRANIASDDPIRAIPPVARRSSSGTLVKVVIGLVVAAIIGLLLVVAAGAVFYYASRTGQGSPEPSVPQPSPVPTFEQISDAERRELKETLANLQRTIDETAKAANSNRTAIDEDPLLDAPNVATVASPNDGFLALRSEPSSDYGERLARIPHGDTLVVVSCDDEYLRIAGRRGRWCLVEWRGRAGWVFDAWLKY
jgi:uncharacterized membrane protein